MKAIESEIRKYQKAWAIPDYANFSPGEEIAELFEEICRPAGTVIDLGTGSGKGAARLIDMGLDVTILDLTFDGLIEELSCTKIQASLWDRWGDHNPRGWDWGFCADVMEHIPPEFSMLVIDRILENCRNVFFHICLVPDSFGKVIGEQLHLTVKSFEWWRDHLSEFGKVVECRDLMNNGVYYVQR